MTALLIRNFGILLMLWSLVVVMINPFLENKRLRLVSVALLAAGSVLFVVGITLLAVHP